MNSSRGALRFNQRMYLNNRPDSLYDQPKKPLLCEEFIVAKILVRFRGINTLRTTSFYQTGHLSDTLCGKLLLSEINRDTMRYLERKNGKTVADLGYDVYGFAKTEEPLPKSLMGRYIYLKRQLGEVSEAVPPSLIECYQDLDSLVRSQGLFTGRFKSNLKVMADCYGLNEKEIRVYAIMNLLRCSTLVRNAFDCFSYSDRRVSLLQEVLAGVLDLQKEEVNRLLSPSNRLKQLGLIKDRFYSKRCCTVEPLFRVFPAPCVSTRDLLWKELTADDFLDPWVVGAEAAQNCLEDFYYLPEVKDCIIPLLRELSGVKHSGVNILLHGPSGSGKTELSRVIAKELGFKAYKLSKDIPEKMGRWQAWETASKILRSKPDTLMIVDEAEEFYNNPYDLGSGARVGKGDIIHSLEAGAAPTIWITNSLAGMDPSILRSFQFILGVTNPPKEQMQKIAKHKLGKYLSAENIARILNIPQVSPANLNQAGLLAEDLMNSVCPIPEDRLMSVISGILKAQDCGELIHSGL